jgi:gamma-resorcylate decarboxylase
MKRPDRYAALAALPMQEPTAAIAELERSIIELGFCGVLVNGHSCLGDEDTGLYLDDPAYLPFWERLEALDVPFYLHPRNPLPSQCRIYEGHAELLGAPWAFSAETAVHALRLMTSGLFDRFPGIKIVLGHLGETLPFVVHRAASRMNTQRLGIRRTVAEYFHDNFVITTSGNFHNPTFIGAMLELGVERVLLALDYPFADTEKGSRWFDSLELTEDARLRIGCLNAVRLFRLPHHLAMTPGATSPAESS